MGSAADGAPHAPAHRDRLALPLRGPRQVLLRQLDVGRLSPGLALVPGRRLPVDGLAPGRDRARGRGQHRRPDPDRPPPDHRHPHPRREPRRDGAAPPLLPRQPAARGPRARRACRRPLPRGRPQSHRDADAGLPRRPAGDGAPRRRPLVRAPPAGGPRRGAGRGRSEGRRRRARRRPAEAGPRRRPRPARDAGEPRRPALPRRLRLRALQEAAVVELRGAESRGRRHRGEHEDARRGEPARPQGRPAHGEDRRQGLLPPHPRRQPPLRLGPLARPHLRLAAREGLPQQGPDLRHPAHGREVRGQHAPHEPDPLHPDRRVLEAPDREDPVHLGLRRARLRREGRAPDGVRPVPRQGPAGDRLRRGGLLHPGRDRRLLHQGRASRTASRR